MDTATRVRTAYFSKLADKYHPMYGYEIGRASCRERV